MTPVMQSVQHDPAGTSRGDCFRACVATILDLPADAVPHFCESPTWFVDADEWLSRRGLGLLLIESRALPQTCWHAEDAPYIASGKSPRGDWLHSVVYRAGRLAHDPHPSGAGLDGEPTDFILFLALDPARSAPDHA